MIWWASAAPAHANRANRWPCKGQGGRSGRCSGASVPRSGTQRPCGSRSIAGATTRWASPMACGSSLRPGWPKKARPPWGWPAHTAAPWARAPTVRAACARRMPRGRAMRGSTSGAAGQSRGARPRPTRGGPRGRGQPRWCGRATRRGRPRWARSATQRGACRARILSRTAAPATGQTCGRPARRGGAPSRSSRRRWTRGGGSRPWPPRRPRRPRKEHSAPSASRCPPPRRAPSPRGPRAAHDVLGSPDRVGGADRAQHVRVRPATAPAVHGGAPHDGGGGAASGHSAPSRGTGLSAVPLRCVRPGVSGCGAVGSGGPWNKVVRQRKPTGAWLTRQCAKPPAGLITGARGGGPTSCAGSSSSGWKKTRIAN
jgi:hypothetical protein